MDVILASEGYALMGAAFEVHNHLGGGLLEEIYHHSLEVELELRGIPYRSREGLKVYYKGRVLPKRYVPDLIVFDKVVVELKSVTKPIAEHQAQLLNYIRITRKPVGFLINFGPLGKLEYQRFVLSEFF